MTQLRSLVDYAISLIDELQAMRDAIVDKHPDSVEWKLLYDIIFGPQGQENVSRVLRQIGINEWRWSDPDTSYMEDACAYLSSLDELKTKLLSLFSSSKV